MDRIREAVSKAKLRWMQDWCLSRIAVHSAMQLCYCGECAEEIGLPLGVVRCHIVPHSDFEVGAFIPEEYILEMTIAPHRHEFSITSFDNEIINRNEWIQQLNFRNLNLEIRNNTNRITWTVAMP